MRTREEAIAACLSFPDAFEDYPFSDLNYTAMRHKTNQKTFAFILEREGKIWINLKVDPQWRNFWIDAYEAVVPGYHMNKTHWISVILDGSMTDGQIIPLIEESYNITQSKKRSKNK
ncbi:MAG: MmcQ/YjbR family DNA-binding protein [Clostridia bacterium]|nr:MmcQ/YjbR family DNA-binding protein [Clostridia bacterium]